MEKFLDETILAKRIRDAGFKATPQRLSIYQAVLESEEHPKAETVYQHLREAHPSFTLATVYRTLESFADAGLIRRVFHPGQSKRYDGKIHPHHHLVCTQCEQVLDFAFEQIELPYPPSNIEGFHPQKIEIQVLGICSACKNKS